MGSPNDFIGVTCTLCRETQYHNNMYCSRLYRCYVNPIVVLL